MAVGRAVRLGRRVNIREGQGEEGLERWRGSQISDDEERERFHPVIQDLPSWLP